MTRAQKVMFVDLDWTPANNWQAEDRICRIGSKHSSVEVIHMLSDHPLDIHVHNLIEEKKKLIMSSLDITA
jgi:SNF2 family DNA or RNA helicase